MLLSINLLILLFTSIVMIDGADRWNIDDAKQRQHKLIQSNDDESNETMKRFTILHFRNAKNSSSKIFSLCAVGISTEKLEPHGDDDDDHYNQNNFAPLHHHSVDLCDKNQNRQGRHEDSNNGYHLFDYTDDCDINEQMWIFFENFPLESKTNVSSGIIFSTPCNVNISSHFNLSKRTLELIDRFNLSLSVINSNKAPHRLEQYDQMAIPKLRDSSISFLPMALIFIIACSTVFIGSWWSGKVRHEIFLQTGNNLHPTDQYDQSSILDSDKKKNEQSFTNISMLSVLILVLSMISALLLLYLFYKYLVYLILFLFILTSISSLFFCSSCLMDSILPKKWVELFFKIPHSVPCCSDSSIRYIDIILLLLSFFVPIFWFVRRFHPEAWLLQDFLGFVFCINTLRMLRLPSMKICTYLSSILFFYDIFFVFITPLITSGGESIMVEVATGKNRSGSNYLENRCDGPPIESIPMLFRVPYSIYGFNDFDIISVCLNKMDSMLGLGDVMIPGLLVSYCAAFDRIQNIPYRLYFFVSFFSYAIGLIFTFIALILMKGTAQPALLYLVPCTLLPLLIMAFIRKEFRTFWHSPEKQMKLEEQSNSS
ncbi:Signal peptide peptidase-like 2A [Sarcoptes scabiei]|uniref:Signal peptide peptidase-like 2A n=1 Tax=Sarcoptes scabiei TaxID=52283 RepID=A0A834R1K0_SARSC|nr:Signal peptide peptidase-like 2A [Sarcoptes scabiei]